MTIIEVPQGHYRNLANRDKDEIISFFKECDADFLARHPQCVAYHRPSWRLLEDVDARNTAPWGYEWYEVMADNRLRVHSAQYDSSG